MMDIFILFLPYNSFLDFYFLGQETFANSAFRFLIISLTGKRKVNDIRILSEHRFLYLNDVFLIYLISYCYGVEGDEMGEEIELKRTWERYFFKDIMS